MTALYAPKQLLTHLLGGRNFFSYELLDEAPPYVNTNVATRESGFGFVETPALDAGMWQAKPGFHAMRRLLGLLRDDGTRPADSLGVELTSSNPSVRSVEMSRSDGRHLLATWQAVDLYEWDRRTLSGSYVEVNPVEVGVSLDSSMPVSVYEPSTAEAPVSRFTAQTFSQSVGAGVQVLQIG